MSNDTQHKCLEQLLGAIDQAPFAALLLLPDESLTLAWRNAAHAKMTNSVGQNVAGCPLFEAFPPSDDAAGVAAKQAIFDCVTRIKSTKQAEDIGPYRYDIVDETGSFVEHHWQMQMSPFVEDGQVEAILQVSQDVTAQVLEGRFSETLQRATRSSAAISFFAYEPDTGSFSRSDEIDAMFGFVPGEVGDTATPFFERVHAEDLPNVYAEIERVFCEPTGAIASLDHRIAHTDGSERFVRVRAEVAIDPKDRKRKLVGTFVDLTDLEENRRELAKSLELKDALATEANHRIKNSLAISLGMLRIEQRELEGMDAIEPHHAVESLKSVEARIRAVSDVHGLMQLGGDGTSVSLMALLDRLVQFTRDSAGISSSDFHYDAPASDFAFDSDRAVSLGLVLNEVMTNALKYGLEDEGQAAIRIAASLSKTHLNVTVANDIAGDSRFSDIHSTQIGSRLVAQIADQLDAALETTNDGQLYTTHFRMPL